VECITKNIEKANYDSFCNDGSHIFVVFGQTTWKSRQEIPSLPCLHSVKGSYYLVLWWI